eukprot:4184814-Prymnesium_polylepis.1
MNRVEQTRRAHPLARLEPAVAEGEAERYLQQDLAGDDRLEPQRPFAHQEIALLGDPLLHHGREARLTVILMHARHVGNDTLDVDRQSDHAVDEQIRRDDAVHREHDAAYPLPFSHES